MIRKLKEEDRARILDFLSEEAAINLFIIGDIENFGFDEDFQELWASFDEEENIEGVLLRYNESYIPYYKSSQFDISGFKSIIELDETNKILSGKESIVDHFRGILRQPSEKGMYFCELREKGKLKDYGEEIKIATVEDAVRIYDLLEEIEEFQATDTNSVERIERIIRTKAGRIYYMEDDEGTIMTVTQTTAENSKSAMVVGVATRKAYRKRGYMSQCLSKLCNDLLSEGKSLCLFYNNPEAGSVYHKMGFESIGRWKMLIEGKKVDNRDASSI